jgi:hypothetical protein
MWFGDKKERARFWIFLDGFHSILHGLSLPEFWMVAPMRAHTLEHLDSMQAVAHVVARVLCTSLHTVE